MLGSKSQGTQAARWEPCADRETVREPCGGWPGPSGLPRRRVLCPPWFSSRRRGTRHRNHRAGPPGPLTGETSFLLERQSPPRGGESGQSPWPCVPVPRPEVPPGGSGERGRGRCRSERRPRRALAERRSMSESNPFRAGKPDDLTLKTSLLLLLLFLKGGTFSNRSRK